MATVKEYAGLSSAAYSGAKTMGDWTAIRWSSDSGDLKTGLQAIVYQHATTGELVMVVAGTAFSDGADLGNDRDIANGIMPTQFTAVEAFYNEVKKKYANEKITATGHSLGGADVSYLGYLYPELEVYSFNGPGIGHIKVLVQEQNEAGETILVEKTIAEAINPENNIHEYRINGDPLSGIGEPIGEQHRFDPVVEVGELVNSMGDSGWSLVDYLHSIKQWLGDLVSYDSNGNPIKPPNGDTPSGDGDGNPLQPPSGGGLGGSGGGGGAISGFLSGLGGGLSKLFGPFSATPMGKLMNWLPFIPFFFNPRMLFAIPANVDPIILDLSKDGIKTTGVNSSAHFDYEGNGFAESTAWISSTDGLLVMDRDGNGIIDSGKELFGDQTFRWQGRC